MMIHVLVEGRSDEPVVDEILRRRFGLVRGSHFCVHPHMGKGRLPADLSKRPIATDRTLLGQLPSTLRALSRKGAAVCVVVLVDQDDDDCRQLKSALLRAYSLITPRPPRVLFRIAMEEVESWFLADRRAVERAYGSVDWSRAGPKDADEVDDPSEVLARLLSVPVPCSGAAKFEWARAIAPYLDLKRPRSPSLMQFINGISNRCGLDSGVRASR